MKIIKLSSSKGSFCSTELKSISRMIKEQLRKGLKSKSGEKLVLEIYDINDINLTLNAQAINSNKTGTVL